MKTIYLPFGLVVFSILFSFSVQAQRIFIDPGHSDSDVRSGNRTALEVETNLTVALKLRDRLLADSSRKWTVLLSRIDGEGDKPTTINQRATMANDWGTDRLLSIHCNAGGDTGTETFWCDVDSNFTLKPTRNIDQDLARKVQSNMVEYGKWKDRRVVEDFTYVKENGKPIHLGILRYSIAPSCLNEIGFVDNPGDADKLKDDGWRNEFARAYLSAFQAHYGLPSVNNPPIAEAAVSINPNGPYYGYENPLLVTKGQNVALYFFADKDVNGDGKASYDPDGWTDPENGVSSGGKAEWNTDLNQGTPDFEKVISNPSSSNVCNIGPYSYTFNDPSGTYEYQILRITDSKGAQSNVSKLRIQVIDKGTECFFADLDCDEDVDTEDVRRIALCWDTQVGDVLYNSDYDFNKDGKINLLDVRRVAQYWGQTAPFDTAAPSITQVNSNPREVIAYLQENLPEVRIGEITTVEEEFQGMELHLSYDSQKLKATYAGLEKGPSFIILGPKIHQQGTISIGAVLLGKQEVFALTSEILSAVKFTTQQERDSAPHIFALGQNFPNPFNPETWIPYQLAESSNVQIRIYNVSGQLIRALDLGYKDAGYYQDRASAVYWDGRNEIGEKPASGVYFYTIKAGDFTATRKMLLIE